MKPPILVFVTFGLSLVTASANAVTPPEPHHLQPNAPRSVTVTEAETPPGDSCGPLAIDAHPPTRRRERSLPSSVEISVDWVFDGGHVASRFISVKPKLANATTDIHIVSDHGNEYTLQLQEISADADAHFDSKVFIVPGDKAAKDRLTDMPVFVPAAELDKVKQEAVAAKAAQATELKSEETKAETYRSQYPGSLHFDFTWDEKKGKELGLQQIWHDDKFTYLRGQFQETPALYELKDGKGSLINFDYNAGLYTVPKQLETGYLAIGKKRVDFHRSQEKN